MYEELTDNPLWLCLHETSFVFHTVHVGRCIKIRLSKEKDGIGRIYTGIFEYFNIHIYLLMGHVMGNIASIARRTKKSLTISNMISVVVCT